MAPVRERSRARAEQVTSFVTSFLGATPSAPDWVLVNKGVSLRVVELADDIGERPRAMAASIWVWLVKNSKVASRGRVSWAVGSCSRATERASGEIEMRSSASRSMTRAAPWL